LTGVVTALDEFQSLGVDFVSVSEGVDTTTPIGKMTFTIIAAIDEFFLDTLKENTKAGLAAARRRGRRLGRPRAERRHADQRDARLDLDAARALLATGVSRREVARRLQLPEATLRRALARTAASTAANPTCGEPDG
jgi:DNA invertase Pin-like site-specific DNA recombinase